MRGNAPWSAKENARQKRDPRLILFSQMVPKTLGAVSLAASGSFFWKLESFPSVVHRHQTYNFL